MCTLSEYTIESDKEGRSIFKSRENISILSDCFNGIAMARQCCEWWKYSIGLILFTT
jgi:L-rhamnose mutarotase